ncbi:MAG: hypothetical protein J6L70_03740 [Alphaproteobacteria bacterium]|nr:hypothetical protein [Alphaproteobacteria bacterium]
MRRFWLLALLLPSVAWADLLPLDEALRATYLSCVGIDEELSDMKTMAGINTAVTAVGTAAAGGATVVGFVKQSTDKDIEELEKLWKEIQAKPEHNEFPTNEELDAFMAEFNTSYESAVAGKDNIESEIDRLTKKSKNLGNWRTGLLAGSTATNVAGAVIAGVNKVDEDLKTQIDNCIAAVGNLRNSITQARINGVDVAEAETIARECGEYEYVDVSKINKRGKGAMISSAVGAATGLAGTITSGVANTDKTRNDNSEAGKAKEKNLNTAANVLSIGTTAASATATVFNATQISAIKKVAAVAEKCTGVLK